MNATHARFESLIIVHIIILLTGLNYKRYLCHASQEICDAEGFCHSQYKSNPTDNKRKVSNCYDKESTCKQLESQGMCASDPGSMVIHCANTCNYCHLQAQEVRCNRKFLNISSSRAYRRTEMNSMFNNVAARFGEKYGAKVLSRDPWIVSFDHFLTSKECDNLVKALENSGSAWRRSTEFGGQGSTGVVKYQNNDIRTSSSAWCVDACHLSEAALAISKKIEGIVNITNVMNQSENFQV